MATFKSRVHTVNRRSSRLSFADLEAVKMNGTQSSRSHDLYLPAVVKLGMERAVMFHNISRLLLKSRPHCLQTPEINGLCHRSDCFNRASVHSRFDPILLAYSLPKRTVEGPGRGCTSWGYN